MQDSEDRIDFASSAVHKSVLEDGIISGLLEHRRKVTANQLDFSIAD